MATTPAALPLDIFVTVIAPDGSKGQVVDVFTETSYIHGREVHWPVYVVQMPGYSTQLTAKAAARKGWTVEEPAT